MSKLLRVIAAITLASVMFMGCASKGKEETKKEASTTAIEEESESKNTNVNSNSKFKNTKDAKLAKVSNGDYKSFAKKIVEEKFPNMEKKDKVVEEYAKFLEVNDEFENMKESQKYDSYEEVDEISFKKPTGGELKGVSFAVFGEPEDGEVGNYAENILRVSEDEKIKFIGTDITIAFTKEKDFNDDIKTALKKIYSEIEIDKITQYVSQAFKAKESEEEELDLELEYEVGEEKIYQFAVRPVFEDGKLIGVGINVEILVEL